MTRRYSEYAIEGWLDLTGRVQHVYVVGPGEPDRYVPHRRNFYIEFPEGFPLETIRETVALFDQGDRSLYRRWHQGEQWKTAAASVNA